MDRCEWNPALSTMALDPPRPDDCPNEAVLSVGRGAGNWHLCESCAMAPEFKRYRRRDPLKKTSRT